MKKLLLMLLAAGSLTVGACGDDDEDPINNNDPNQTPVDNEGKTDPNQEVTPEPNPSTGGTTYLHIKNNSVADPVYAAQYVVASGLGLKQGTHYEMTAKVKASAPATITIQIGGFHPDCFTGSIDVNEEMQEYTVPFDAVVDDGHVMFQSGAFVGDIWIESIKITHKGSGKTQALSKEEKRDTLIWAMDHWIAGMMEATDGFVTAWDVVNEALSGDGDDGQGNYPLQHNSSRNTDPTSVQNGLFFWQDDMGDLEYVRTAVKSARKHFKGDPSELKLFINDYNLESNWDDNKKLKSLINWIKKWEADGETYIDGIGTKMHITCYEDENVQKSMEEHIVKMFTLMAETGKLVRVSELDMGYKRGSGQWGGNNLTTAQVTAEEHQKMADYYEFILNKYFEIVPPAQQYGFCQWCTTDAPSNSGWRKNEPVGIWTLNYKERKTVYKGFAQGLAGTQLGDGEPNSLQPLKSYIDRDAHPIFKFSGAIEAWDFNNNQKLRDTMALHFDEIVAGNSMKYSSCVNGNGALNFGTVKDFCEKAKAVGLTIYGHTLAWHSQQQPGYLNSLLKAKEVEVPDAEKVDVTDFTLTYDKIKSYNMWHDTSHKDYTVELVKE
ncbi:MAG: endo-1,4-beta-xylanase [Bacteroidales bacterium]|nr:endo-1,4-beta-xylanase [Bacteroidales bacterium]